MGLETGEVYPPRERTQLGLQESLSGEDCRACLCPCPSVVSPGRNGSGPWTRNYPDQPGQRFGTLKVTRAGLESGRLRAHPKLENGMAQQSGLLGDGPEWWRPAQEWGQAQDPGMGLAPEQLGLGLQQVGEPSRRAGEKRGVVRALADDVEPVAASTGQTQDQQQAEEVRAGPLESMQKCESILPSCGHSNHTQNISNGGLHIQRAGGYPEPKALAQGEH